MSVTPEHNHPERGITAVPTTAIDSRSATPLVVGIVLLALAVIAYFALGMPGMNHTASNTGLGMPGHTGHRVVDPGGFEATMLDPEIANPERGASIG